VRYVVTSAPGGKRCATTGMSCSVRGLSLGIAYTFTVAASDATGSATSTVASSLASKVDPGSTAIVLKARSIPVTVKCERASCEGVASVTVARRIMRGSKQVGWRHLVLGRTSFRLGTGEQAELRLAETTLGKTLLPRQTKWWLARQPRFHLTLTLKILDGVTTNTAVHLRAR